MNHKVSIIVPVYNVSNFIERCAISLFEQTYDNIEYVFVNDCTPDDSIEKIKKVLEKYPHRTLQTFFIDHINNRGLAAARNSGIIASNGEFILNIDSDDYIDLNMVEVMLSKAIQDESDIVICDFSIEWERVSKIHFQKYCENGADYACLLLKCEALPGVVNKLIRRTLYDFVKPIEGINYGEDYVTTTRMAFYANKISKVNNVFYHYVQYNNHAYTKKVSDKNVNDIVSVFGIIDDFYKDLIVDHSIRQAINYGKLYKKSVLLLEADNFKRKKIVKLFPEVNAFSLSTFSFPKTISFALRLAKLKNIWFLNILYNIYEYVILNTST